MLFTILNFVKSIDCKFDGAQNSHNSFRMKFRVEIRPRERQSPIQETYEFWNFRFGRIKSLLIPLR